MKILETIRTYRYELIALTTSASVMMLEIVGARLIAPYFGASLYTWTAMIGVILGAISVGFWYGGRLADRDDPRKSLATIITAAAALILVTSLFQAEVLEVIASQNLDLRISALLAALILFSVPSFFIGMVSPHLAKIRLTSLKTSGAVIGRLEAAGALGSIIGTFLSGYFLLAYLGAQTITVCLSILLIMISFLAAKRGRLLLRLGIIVVAILIIGAQRLPAQVLADIDTPYNRYQVTEAMRDNRYVRYLLTDRRSVQSAQFPDSPAEPVFSYVERMAQLAAAHPNPERILIIGGGAFTLPIILSSYVPNAQVDIVEIDPELGPISEKYFNFASNPKIKAYFEDGRSYLNRDNHPYDVIFVDAYNSLTTPFHLTTREFDLRIKQHLKPGGVIMANVVDKGHGQFLASMKVTYESVFKHTHIYQADADRLIGTKQNFMLVATDSDNAAQYVQNKFSGRVFLTVKGIILTDDYAPVERISY